MLKKPTTIIIAILLGLTLLQPSITYAACTDPLDCANKGITDVKDGGGSITLEEGIKAIVNALLFLISIIAVIMIIIGGIRYTTSNGDSAQVQSAKSTVLYAVIGLVVALIAYAIISFVISALSGSGTGRTARP